MKKFHQTIETLSSIFYNDLRGNKQFEENIFV